MNINKRKLADALEKYLNDTIHKLSNEEVSDRVSSIIADYLKNLESRGSIIQSKVDVTHVTWSSMWPKWYQRWWARFTYRLVKVGLIKRVSNHQHWWHTVFPFKIEYVTRVPDNEATQIARDMLGDDFDPYENIVWKLIPRYTAELEVPFGKMNADIYIQPTKPLEKIVVTLKVTKPDGTFLDPSEAEQILKEEGFYERKGD